MFYLTAKVGSMFAVYDDSDSTIEWYTKAQLEGFLNLGVVIKGFNKSESNPVPHMTCDCNSCKWTKSKRSIFDVADRVQYDTKNLVVFAEGKKYKGKVLAKSNDSTKYVLFTNGLVVPIPELWIRHKA